MADLTYDDFKSRLSIKDILEDAGYTYYLRDGLRYPSYVRYGSDGRRVRGDKFIVTANGQCCFQPPDRKVYNIISFIKEHPNMFAEYQPGMKPDRLVNLVCNRLLNNPVERGVGGNSYHEPKRDSQPFDIYDYDVIGFNRDDWESQKKFYPYFKGRGISLDTQRAFCGHFMLATKEYNGRQFTNLSFPLSLPEWPGKEIVGLEQRGRPNAEGKSYKGMAEGSHASEGIWIARLENHVSDRGFTVPLDLKKQVYWFESAFDAMAFYQLQKKNEPLAYHDLGNAVYVSTGGNPTTGQIKGMIAQTGNAMHILYFDNDDAGQKFCEKFESLAPKGLSVHRLLPEEPHKDWNDQLLDHRKQEEEADKTKESEVDNERKGGFRR